MQDRSLETLILVVSQQKITVAEEILRNIKVYLNKFRVKRTVSKMNFQGFKTAREVN